MDIVIVAITMIVVAIPGMYLVVLNGCRSLMFSL